MDVSRLRDDIGNQVRSSTSGSDNETISLDGLAPGYYDLQIYGYNGATNPEYTLTIRPPSNAAPTIECTAPPLGDILVQHGAETYPVTWTASDPDSDPIWVTVYANRLPQLDGHEQLLPTSINADGSLGLHVLNTSYLSLGPYYLYCEVNDGGSVSGDWSEGTITLFDPAISTPPVIVSPRSLQAAPNPFNPYTVLRLDLDRAERWVDWRILDGRGRLVRQLAAGPLAAGQHVQEFGGRDDRGRALSSGVYYAEVRGSDWLESEKLVLVK